MVSYIYLFNMLIILQSADGYPVNSHFQLLLYFYRFSSDGTTSSFLINDIRKRVEMHDQ